MILLGVCLAALAVFLFWFALRYIRRSTNRQMQRLDRDLQEQIEAISGPALRQLEAAVAGAEQPLSEASQALARSVQCLEKLLTETEMRAVVREEVSRLRPEVREDYITQTQPMNSAMAAQGADFLEPIGATKPEVDWEHGLPGLVAIKGETVVVCPEEPSH